MAPRFALLAVLVALSMVLAGCLDPYRPQVDPAALEAARDAGRHWQVHQLPLDSRFFGPSIVETQYRFEPTGAGPPFPGLLVLIGVRSLGRSDPAELLEKTREVLQDVMAEEGVELRSEQEQSGQRTLQSGAQTKWFTLVGDSTGSGGIFSSSREIRALGETWYDGVSNTDIIAIAIAQTSRSGTLPGTTVQNTAVWNDLVGDPAGSVGGAVHSQGGLIYHVRSHR